MSVSIKFKMANAPTFVEYFETHPSWKCLTSTIANRFCIARKDVAVTYILPPKDSVTIIDDRGLQQYYNSLGRSSKIKFVVQDRQKPNSRAEIISTFSSDFNQAKVSFFCWLLHESANPFSVDIEKGKTVAKLQEAIKLKKENAFAGIDPDSLNIWKVNFSISVLRPTKDARDAFAKRIKDIHFPDLHSDDAFNEGRDVQLLDAAQDVSYYWQRDPDPKTLNVIIQAPAIERPAKRRKLGGAQMFRTPSKEKHWSVLGALDLGKHYHVDPATQAASQHCLGHIDRGDFCLLTGSRASGKTTRLHWIRSQLVEANIWNLYVSFEGINLVDPPNFWESFGFQVINAVRKCGLKSPELKISSLQDFLNAFHVTKWEEKLVLLLDEFSSLYKASDDVRNQCLGAFREIKNNHDTYAIRSVLAAGTFSIVHLEPTDGSLSPFNVSTHVQNPNFTLHETRVLFEQFTENTGIDVEEDVVEDVWVKAGGHPGMICLCGRAIALHISSLALHGTVSYERWFEFHVQLSWEVAEYSTFRSMIESLHNPGAMAAVRLLRSDFLGYSGDVTLLDYQEQRLADFLTAEGVLFKPDRVTPTYRMTSALIDELLRQSLIADLFRNTPRITPPLDDSETLDFLRALVESLKSFDREHIRMSACRSFKLSKAIKVNGSRNAQVPRESVYDTELMRILSNWLKAQHGWLVTSQRHLNNPFGKHKYTDIVLQKKGHPTIVLELLATGDEESVNSHIDKTPEYMNLLRAQKAWIIHFTCEDHYVPVWQSEDMLNKGINLVHIWHNLEFTKAEMVAHCKGSNGITHLDTHWQTISL